MEMTVANINKLKKGFGHVTMCYVTSALMLRIFNPKYETKNFVAIQNFCDELRQMTITMTEVCIYSDKKRVFGIRKIGTSREIWDSVKGI